MLDEFLDILLDYSSGMISKEEWHESVEVLYDASNENKRYPNSDVMCKTYLYRIMKGYEVWSKTKYETKRFSLGFQKDMNWLKANKLDIFA